MRLITLLILIILTSHSYANDCAEFEAEAEAYEGVIPKFDANGKLRALLMYGESTFLTAKRSLINDARRKAELNAKRAYAEFLKSDFDSETLSANLVETAQITDENGETDGYANELSSTLNQMKSSSNSVLSGIVKLDECVNSDGKYVLVAMGWKPATSKAAADAKITMNNTKGNNLNQTVKPHDDSNQKETSASSSQNNDQIKSNKVSGIGIVSVEAEGFGTDLNRATNDALTRAISQVFGEKFASQTNVIDSINSLSITGSSGKSIGAAIETSQTTNSVNSSTSGIISSWSYINKQKNNDGYHVLVMVSMPKYNSSIDSNKSTVVIAVPQISGNQVVQDELYNIFTAILVSELEQQINQSTTMTVIDRKFAKQINSELASVANSGNMSELARLGNKVGADILLIPVIEKFKHEIETRKIGDSIIERTVFNVSLTSRMIEVSTSNLIDNKKFPLKNKKIKSDTPGEEIGNFFATKLSSYLIRKMGGQSENNNAFESKPSNNYKHVKTDADKQYENLKKDVENDW